MKQPLEPQPFTKILCMLDNKNCTTVEQFKRSNLFLSTSQWIDSRKFLTRRGAAIASGIFELFGQFSGKSGIEVREDLMVWISENKSDVQTCVKIVLDHKGYNLSYWMTKMSRIQTPADDIAIYCLARMYKRHVIIHTSRFPWSTLSRQCKMSVEETMACSDIKLILLGDGKFAEIRNIRTPTLPGTWPCPTHYTKNGKTTTNKQKRTKTTCREGHKPGSSVITRQAIKSSRETPTNSPQKVHNTPPRERVSTRPLRENRCDINYSVFNDSYDDEAKSPKRRRRHSSRPRSEPTTPRQAAQKKIVETKIHLPSQNDNLDLEKIMDSQYPALQLVPLSGITTSTTDKKEPYEEEYVTPVLGTITVHGVTENKPDLDNDNTDVDLEEMAMTENKTETIETESDPDSTSLQIQPDDISLPKNSDNIVTETGNGVTKNPEGFAQTLQPPNTNSTIELHGVTNNSRSLTSETTDPALTRTATVEINTIPTETSDVDNSSELKGLTPTDDIPLATHQETNTEEINGVTTTLMQNTPEQNEPETLPDLVLNENAVVNEVNTTEDEDEAAEALLKLSKPDMLSEDDTELPLGVLPVDAAPVPITLGNQDVLNAIENFKQTNCNTGTGSNNSDDPKTTEDAKRNNNEKEIKNNDKKNNTEPKSVPESSPPTSPAKGNLVIVKHGIWRKKSTGRTYKCAQCNKHKSSTQELNKHYRLKHKPVMCSICNKLFDLPGTLKKHMYGHLDKPYKFDKCSESFHFESELSNHKVVHRTIRTHFCMAQNCGRSFMRKSDLSIHVQTHDNDTWQCAECDWKTSCKKYLQAHLIGHEEDLHYKCDQCDKRCKFREQLRRHKKKEHNTTN